MSTYPFSPNRNRPQAARLTVSKTGSSSEHTSRGIGTDNPLSIYEAAIRPLSELQKRSTISLFSKDAQKSLSAIHQWLSSGLICLCLECAAGTKPLTLPYPVSTQHWTCQWSSTNLPNIRFMVMVDWFSLRLDGLGDHSRWSSFQPSPNDTCPDVAITLGRTYPI